MKTKLNYAFRHQKKWQKILLVMRLKLFILLCTCYTTYATAFAQYQKLDVSFKNETVETVLQELQKQTGVQFFYLQSTLATADRVTVEMKQATLQQILDNVLKGQGYSYEISDGVVSIFPEKTQQQAEKNPVSIRGTVKTQDGSPLPGVTVRLAGTNVGTATDADGKYALTLPQGEGALEFSFIGYKTQKFEFTGKNLQQNVDIVLEEDVTEMDEVVVTGIFTKAKESYTGAVTTITSKELSRAGNRNILTSIQNLDPSFNIVSNIDVGSDPNSLPDITVRGSASMGTDIKDLKNESQNTANLPLFIMDGFEITLERMMDLDDNQVESITLLKDASATAMYGSRGANGVVVITTKRPEAGKLRITYKGSLNIEAPDLSSYNLMNAREKLEYEVVAGLYTGVGGDGLEDMYNLRKTDVERGVDTYWLKYPVRTGVGHKHSLRLEGGSESFRYAANIGYNNIRGTMKGSDRNTFNGGVYLSYNHANITFQNDLQVSSNKSNNSPYGSFSDYGKLNSYWTPYDEEGNLIKVLEDFRYLGSGRDGKYSYVANPLYDALLPQKDEKRYTSIANNFALEWKILPELVFRGRFGVNWQTNRSDVYVSAADSQFDSYKEEDYNRKGTYSYGTGNSFGYEADFTLNFSKVWKEVHSLYAGADMNFAQDKSESYTITAEGITNINMDFLGMAGQYTEGGRPSGSESMSRRVGGILNVNYTYDRRYFVDLSGKMEASSKFGSDNRLAPFWSLGAGWNIHKEHFMPKNNILNEARLRLSYGTSGSQSFNSYQAMTTFSDFGGDNYHGWYGVYLMAMGNEDLGWQKTGQFNIGLETKLFDGRWALNFDVYHKLTDDLLSDITLPSSAGFNTYKANVGKVENRGVELNTTVYVLRNTEKELIWTLGGSLVHNKNKIKKISNTLEFLNEQINAQAGANPSFLYEEGQSMNTIFAVKSLGIDPANGKEMYVKRDGTITYVWDAEDKVPCGINEPKVFGNLNTMFRWKGLTLNAIFSYRLGGQMYNSTLVSKVENIYPSDNADRRALYDRWKAPGDKAFFKGVRDFTNTNASSRFVMDENTLECQSISLGYDWTGGFLNKLGISYLNLTGYLEDVFYVSTVKQERGLSYPFSRKFMMSLSLRF